jgi:CRP/FNR family transcriptional regulator, anaerobic regulatory protein
MKEQIRTYFNRYVEFNDSEIDEIYFKLVSKTFKKKEYILREGQICKYKYFIITGLVRSFYIDHKEAEKITLFAIEDWWVTNMESFVNKTPSLVNIQALEPTTVLRLSKEALEELYVSIPKLERLFRMITENMLIAIQRKNDVYMQMKSKERYDDLIKTFPDFIQRVPQYMIASYLEMTPEYLSELRKS